MYFLKKFIIRILKLLILFLKNFVFGVLNVWYLELFLVELFEDVGVNEDMFKFWVLEKLVNFLVYFVVKIWVDCIDYNLEINIIVIIYFMR